MDADDKMLRMLSDPINRLVTEVALDGVSCSRLLTCDGLASRGLIMSETIPTAAEHYHCGRNF